MRVLDHGRKAGYLAAWRKLGARQTLGPELSWWRRRWLQIKALARPVVEISACDCLPLRLLKRRGA